MDRPDGMQCKNLCVARVSRTATFESVLEHLLCCILILA